MAAEIWKKWGSKICPELLYLLQFSIYMTIPISAKIQDGGQKSESKHFFSGARGVAPSTIRVQNLPEITPSLTFFEMNNIFHFCQNSRWRPKMGKV